MPFHSALAQGSGPPLYHEPLKLAAPEPAPLAMFGKSLAAGGDVDGDGWPDVLFGAHGDSEIGDVHGPEAIVYFGPDWTRSARMSHPRGADFTDYGRAVCSPGDVDGDGRADVLVGAPFSTGIDGLAGGEAFLYLQAGAGARLQVISAPELRTGALLGTALACPGDLDGDGKPDIVIGAPGTSGGAGLALVLLGPDYRSKLRLEPPAAQAGAFFASAVAAAGDVDGDGTQDLVVGAPQASPGSATGAGEAHVFFGPDFTRTRTLRMPEPFEERAEFAASVAGVGDVDGDGASEVLVGAPFQDGAGADAGAAYLFFGPDLERVVRLHDPGSADFDVFGTAVAAPGDVDGDGKPDLFVSAPGRNTVHLFRGHDQALLWSYTLPPTENPNRWGESLGAAGDLNDDGAPDLLVGMPRACVPQAGDGTRRAAGSLATRRAEPCTDPDDHSEAGLAKILLSTRPKLQPAPAAGARELTLTNVHPAGSTVSVSRLAPDGQRAELLGQATDGGANDGDGATDGKLTLALVRPLPDGMTVQPLNESTGLAGKPYVARSVPAPAGLALAAALLLAARAKRGGRSRVGR